MSLWCARRRVCRCASDALVGAQRTGCPYNAVPAGYENQAFGLFHFETFTENYTNFTCKVLMTPSK
jgi:hypothetical protein